MRGSRRLDGQVAIITGGAQGLGESLARRLDSEGCSVIVADINYPAAIKVAEGLRDAVAVAVDVTDEQQVDAMVRTAIEKYGKLDLLISNAAILIAKTISRFFGATMEKDDRGQPDRILPLRESRCKSDDSKYEGKYHSDQQQIREKGLLEELGLCFCEIRRNRFHTEPCAGTGRIRDSCQCDLPGQFNGFAFVDRWT